MHFIVNNIGVLGLTIWLIVWLLEINHKVNCLVMIILVIED